jgi:hypothetical protein
VTGREVRTLIERSAAICGREANDDGTGGAGNVVDAEFCTEEGGTVVPASRRAVDVIKLAIRLLGAGRIKQPFPTGQRIASKCLYLSQSLYVGREIDILDHDKLGLIAIRG